MAGIFFTNGELVLCGYQSNKKIPNISGFGGKKEDNDKTLMHTAIRETLEELFNIKPDIELIDNIILIFNTNKITRLIINNDYYLVIYSFDNLELLLQLLQKNNIHSNLYDKFPSNISELIFTRKIDVNVEISHLCLLPLKEKLKINSDFIKDINHFLVQK